MKPNAAPARPLWLARLARLRERRTWVWLHRWIGLVMASFLVIAGLTGSLLAFYDDLDVWVNPELHRVVVPDTDAPLLDAATLRARGQAAMPAMRIDSAIAPYRPDRALLLYMEPRIEGGPPADDELFVNPYTGEILGSRRWGDISQGLVNLMPFIYQFHYSLALGTFGIYLFGIVALLWTFDCFIGAYLTFPRGRPFLRKWRLSWDIKPKRLNFDLHRASGLWTWAMLFVLAWSSVAFNLTEVYYPVTGAVLGFTEHPETPELPVEQFEPGLSWRDAQQRGQELMQVAIAGHGIGAHREDALHYDHHRAEFGYYVATKFRKDGEPYDWFGVTFDANSGELKRVNEENIGPGHERAGDFVTRWLLDLHMARVWGLPFRIFVCCMGIVVTALSVTGLVIWWRKRRWRRPSRRHSIPI